MPLTEGTSGWSSSSCISEEGHEGCVLKDSSIRASSLFTSSGSSRTRRAHRENTRLCEFLKPLWNEVNARLFVCGAISNWMRRLVCHY